MPIDFSQKAPPKSSARPIDPIALFQTLRVTDAAINDLWLVQGDALRQWDAKRAERDIAIVLNTGAGKTLVGLLAAQSLVNETNGPVLYACSSIQLVEQTAEKAHGYGLSVTTYIRGDFDNDLYRQGIAPCVTTYQALFNGRSRFFDEDLAAVVFDDAHTAGHLLRDQFTLQLTNRTFPTAYARLTQLFRPYFSRIGEEGSYLDTVEGRDLGSSRFVPPFAVRQVLGELQRELREVPLGGTVETMFAWAYLRDRLDLCAVFVSSHDVSFTPPVVPARVLPYFQDGVRRLYLSATLRAEDDFLRTFGRVPNDVIKPSTTAGECERLILMPSRSQESYGRGNDVDAAKDIVEEHKCLVLVPTRRRAQAWEDIATISGGDITQQIDDFKRASAPACLVLTARYDGVDLPGDTCRVLVIDDLPTGLNPLERYLWERLNLRKLLRSSTASRVVQSFGRISRGMSDHGVVVLTGSKLIEWILTPKNLAVLPDFLQRQLQIGIDLSQAESVADLADAANRCLARDEDWVAYYQRSMEAVSSQTAADEEARDALEMSRAEVEFGHSLWTREYLDAAKALEQGLEEVFVASRATGAWHALWLGYCYDLLGDVDRAHELYERAHRAERSVPAFDAPSVAENEATYSAQVLSVATALRRGNQPHLVLPRNFDIDLAALDGTGSVPQIEAALEALGEYLGLETRRPDNELGTGPDVLWTVLAGPALSIEAKTAKGENASYRKEDLGQLRDHLQWVREEVGPIEVHSAFVGPVVAASPGANPDPDMVVIELSEFRALRERLRAALGDACAAGVPITAVMTVDGIFRERRLLWPDVYDCLQKHVLQDIRDAP
jgi:tetratricopeptide (TPR) repeat protein